MNNDDAGVDKKVINVLGPLFNLYREKVEEYEQLRKVYTDDERIYITVSFSCSTEE